MSKKKDKQFDISTVSDDLLNALLILLSNENERRSKTAAKKQELTLNPRIKDCVHKARPNKERGKGVAIMTENQSKDLDKIKR